MSAKRLVVIGGSAGAQPSLMTLLAGLPPQLPASVLVVVHVAEQAGSRLPEILGRAGPLPVRFADNGDRLEPGQVLVARPGAHLLVDDGQVQLTDGPPVNRVRPAVDVLFASAAQAAGPAVVSVVLSGALDDGAVGSALVARAGGQTVVEDPDHAQHPSMPAAARRAAPQARACRTEELAEAVRQAVGEPIRPAGDPSAGKGERDMADASDPQFLTGDETGLTRLACPECGGGLADTVLPTITYYRCHIGHQYAPQTLAAAQAEAVEQKLWTAIAALEEQAVVLRHLATQHPDQAAADLARANTARRARRLTQLAELLRTEAEMGES